MLYTELFAAARVIGMCHSFAAQLVDNSNFENVICDLSDLPSTVEIEEYVYVCVWITCESDHVRYNCQMKSISSYGKPNSIKIIDRKILQENSQFFPLIEFNCDFDFPSHISTLGPPIFVSSPRRPIDRQIRKLE